MVLDHDDIKVVFIFTLALYLRWVTRILVVILFKTWCNIEKDKHIHHSCLTHSLTSLTHTSVLDSTLFLPVPHIVAKYSCSNSAFLSTRFISHSDVLIYSQLILNPYSLSLLTPRLYTRVPWSLQLMHLTCGNSFVVYYSPRSYYSLLQSPLTHLHTSDIYSSPYNVTKKCCINQSQCTSPLRLKGIIESRS